MSWLQRFAGGRRRVVALGLALGLCVVAVGTSLRHYADDADPVHLQPKLDQLLGKTGLDPLDPRQPAIRAEALGPLWPGHSERRVRVQLSYADGGRRAYVLPLAERNLPDGGWRYTSLESLLAPTAPLSGVAAARGSAPVRLGAPSRLATTYAPGHFALSGLRDPFGNWRMAGAPVWSPQGDALLVSLPDGDGATTRGTLWLLPAVSTETPRPLLPHFVGPSPTPHWTADGREALTWTASAATPGRPDLVLVNRGGQSRRVPWPVARAISEVAPPPAFLATTADAVLLTEAGRIWRVPLNPASGAQPAWLRDLPNLDQGHDWAEPPVSAHHDAVAYACSGDVCLADLAGDEPRRTALPPLPVAQEGVAETTEPAPPGEPRVMPPDARLGLAWSRDGQQLAVVRSADAHQPHLAVLDRGGSALVDLPVGPNGRVGKPQWTPDGRFVFLPATPDGVRRILAAEPTSGRVFDLSEPHWDAIFSLSPDGTHLVLTNGRGGYWLAPVQYH